jgi:hypothetical protein
MRPQTQPSAASFVPLARLALRREEAEKHPLRISEVQEIEIEPDPRLSERQQIEFKARPQVDAA